MAASAEILGDRWMMLILREAFYGVQRYEDMRADIGAPKAMLTDRLTKLVNLGLLQRTPYQEPGSRTRYAYILTPAGRELGLTFMALAQWGEKNVLKKPAPVVLVDSGTKRKLRVAFVDSNGREVSAEKVRLARRKSKT